MPRAGLCLKATSGPKTLTSWADTVLPTLLVPNVKLSPFLNFQKEKNTPQRYHRFFTSEEAYLKGGYYEEMNCPADRGTTAS